MNRKEIYEKLVETIEEEKKILDKGFCNLIGKKYNQSTLLPFLEKITGIEQNSNEYIYLFYETIKAITKGRNNNKADKVLNNIYKNKNKEHDSIYAIEALINNKDELIRINRSTIELNYTISIYTLIKDLKNRCKKSDKNFEKYIDKYIKEYIKYMKFNEKVKKMQSILTNLFNTCIKDMYEIEYKNKCKCIDQYVKFTKYNCKDHKFVLTPQGIKIYKIVKKYNPKTKQYFNEKVLQNIHRIDFLLYLNIMCKDKIEEIIKSSLRKYNLIEEEEQADALIELYQEIINICKKILIKQFGKNYKKTKFTALFNQPYKVINTKELGRMYKNNFYKSLYPYTQKEKAPKSEFIIKILNKISNLREYILTGNPQIDILLTPTNTLTWLEEWPSNIKKTKTIQNSKALNVTNPYEYKKYYRLDTHFLEDKIQKYRLKLMTIANKENKELERLIDELIEAYEGIEICRKFIIDENTNKIAF